MVCVLLNVSSIVRRDPKMTQSTSGDVLIWTPRSVAYSADGVYEIAQGATWRSGYAAVCKTVYSGSIPDVASNSAQPSIIS